MRRARPSDAQIETVIYAGEAHAELLAGHYNVDESLDNLSLAKDGDENAVQFRKGFFLGDGAGSGKGRQAAGIILDNWLRGRRKAVWISKSDKLIEDAQYDWSALSQEIPSRDGPPAAGLEASAARGEQGLPPANRRRRAHCRSPLSHVRCSGPSRRLQSRRRDRAVAERCLFGADRRREVALRGGLGLRVSTVMGAKRIELTGYSDTEVEQLKSFGLFSEIIAWRLRLFLPLEAHTGIEALSRLFLLYPPL